MNDIVERLREQAATWLSFGWDNDNIFDDATNEIERLQEQAHYHYENGLKKDVEIERLREALKEIAHFNLYGDYSNAYEIPEIARAALKGNE